MGATVSMLSIIIPTYNEAEHIGRTLSALCLATGPVREVLVVDGGSTDGTVEEAEASGVRVVRSAKGRALQMNAGAREAQGDILFFLHADTVPPVDHAALITEAVDRAAVAGCFRLAFDHDHWFLRLNCWFTRFDVGVFRYGDQGLFVQRAVFERVGGFNGTMQLFEDNDMARRLKREGRFRVLPATVITIARKYLDNGPYRMQFVFYRMYLLYRMGLSQERLLRVYRRLIRQDKL